MRIFIELKNKRKTIWTFSGKRQKFVSMEKGNLVVKCAFGYVNSKKCFFLYHITFTKIAIKGFVKLSFCAMIKKTGFNYNMFCRTQS